MRRLRAALLIILTTFATVEASLRVLDPWGARYFDDVQAIWAASTPDVTGYTFVPGRYDFGSTTFTIDPDGNRAVPGRFAGGARVAFVGDSVTFGQGVNDADTWVSRVASALRLDATNHGRSSYSVTNVARVLEGIEGCAVFLTIANDPAHAQEYRAERPYPSLWLTRYLQLALFPGDTPQMAERFAPLYASIAARPDTLILAFDDGGYGDILRTRFGAQLIAPFTRRISIADAHADAAGNRQIAAAALPVIDDWLDKHDCT